MLSSRFFAVRITPSRQTTHSDSQRPHPPSQLRSSRHSPPPHEVTHQRPPWCKVVPLRARRSPRAHLRSRRGRPSPLALPMRCRLFSHPQARVGLIRSGTSDPFGTAARHLDWRRSVQPQQVLKDIPILFASSCIVPIHQHHQLRWCLSMLFCNVYNMWSRARDTVK